MKNLLSAVCAGLFCTLPLSAEAAPISADRIAGHVQILASDAFEGRAPASAGEEKTVAYIARAFADAGLEPGGDVKQGVRQWTQDVPLARFSIRGPVSAQAKTPGGVVALRQGEDVAFRAAATGARDVSIKDAPMVFAGYGVVAPERNWDDFKGLDVRGKIILVLVNDPDFETPAGGAFGGRAMTYYGRWTYKYEEAARQGALGVLVIHETEPAAYGWATVRNSNTAPIFDIIRKDPAGAHALLEGWIQRDAARDLLARAGLDLESLKVQARRPDFKPVELAGVSFAATYGVEVEQIVSQNVVGRLAGTERPDETIIYTSHWDHLGFGEPDASGDRIYNGAVDNADGVAAMIEIARSFAAGPRPARSVVFLAVTAEEKGLLGSEYYAANPLYPLATTVANINMDALSPAGAARDFSIAGSASLTLLDDLVALGESRGRRFSPDSRPEAGSFFRSDHFPFAKRGVPAISFGSGEDLLNGGRAAGAAWERTYVAERYHQPSDEYDSSWNLDGVVQDAELLRDLGDKLARSRDWPRWKGDSEFAPIRAASDEARR